MKKTISCDTTHLITDRTQADVDEVRLLVSRGPGMSPEEAARWTRDLKGAYNASDLNRVIEAVNCIDDVFRACGYQTGVRRQEADWADGQVPTPEQMQTYLSNVQALMDTISGAQYSAELPRSMALLTYVGANSIEQVLTELSAYLTAMTAVFLRAGFPWAYAGACVYFKN